MRIFITGAHGFVGRNFMEKYPRHNYFIPKDGFDPTDINKIIDEFRRRKVDAILHLDDCIDLKNKFDHNARIRCLLGFKNIQSAAAAYNIKKLIILSNEREYDDSFEWTLSTEKERERFKPSDEYGFARYMITENARYDRRAYVLRAFNAYGKYMPKSGFLYESAYAAVKGQKMTAECDSVFSAVYIEDLVKVINDFLTKDFEPGDYNIANPEPVTKKAVLARLKKDSGTDFEIIQDGLGYEHTVSADKFLKAAGANYRFTSFKNGIPKLYKWLCDIND